MTFTKIAVVGGLVLLGLVCWLAASGLSAAREGLVALVALVVLVAGGNVLSGRASPYGRGAHADRRRACEPHEEADRARRDEPAP